MFRRGKSDTADQCCCGGGVVHCGCVDQTVEQCRDHRGIATWCLHIDHINEYRVEWNCCGGGDFVVR